MRFLADRGAALAQMANVAAMVAAPARAVGTAMRTCPRVETKVGSPAAAAP